MVEWRVGNITDLSSHIWYSLSLVELRAGQVARLYSIVPGAEVQEGALQNPFLFLLQCLHSISNLYLLETNLASTLLVEHSTGCWQPCSTCREVWLENRAQA